MNLLIFGSSNQITMKKIIVSCIVLLGLNVFAQEGAIRPNIVSEKPNATEYFLNNPATKPDKVSKDHPIVLTQFNVTIPQDQKFYARTGSGKVSSEDAQLLLKFHLANLDKARFQKATDELATYLLDQLKSKGYKTGSYTDFSSASKYSGIDIKPAPKGEKPELYGPGFTVPGEFKLASEAIMFSAFEQPLYPQQAMKVGYIMIEKKINVLNFGLILNFIEIESDIKNTMTTNSISMNFKGQIYGNPYLGIQSPNMGSITIQPKLDKGKEYSYSFGREFTTSINKENGDVIIDNDKFIAAYLELGKSYIDNMLEVMSIPAKK
jgi:hypothetical protein